MVTNTLGSAASASPSLDPRALADVDRYRLFGEELDALKRSIFAEVGATDVAHVRRLDRWSRRLKIAGRLLIHFSPEPVSFLLGVGALFLYKQIQTAEIGHSALHGAWAGLPGAERYAPKTFHWDAPIDEESWRYGHNVLHHGSTNVASRDPDMEFGFARLTEQTPRPRGSRWAVPFALGVLFPNFLCVINGHVSGLNDLFARPEERTAESTRRALKRSFRKYVPYYAKEYILFPALAGPFFWKVMLGNWLAASMCSAYSAASIFCGHTGEDVKSWPAGTRALGRGHWYAMQVEAANDFEVSLPLSILCGGLDKQIEHHLFPTLPPPRLREIAPRVRAICARYGIPYHTGSWARMLRRAFRQISRLSRPPESGEAGEREAHAA